MKTVPEGLRRAALSLSLAAAWPLHAWAQPAPELRETVVTATRTPQPLTDLLADVSIIDRAAIERSGASGIADLLARLPGVEFHRTGGQANDTTLYLRGGNTQHTAVYLDGVRLDNQAASGGSTWENIPLAQIDRIEVLRGPAAAVYGSDAISGVIQLFTRKGEGPVRPQLQVGAGSHKLRTAAASLSGSAGHDGALDFALGASREISDGFDVMPPWLRASGDRARNPDRDGFRKTSAHARVGLQVDKVHRVDASLLTSSTDAQYDGTHTASRPVDDHRTHALRTAALNWAAQWDPSQTTRVGVSDSRSSNETRPSYYRTVTSLRGYTAQHELRVGAHQFTGLLERREDELDNSSVSGIRNRHQDGVALGYGWRQGPHLLQLNARHDEDSEFGGKRTGSASYGHALTPRLRATGSVATAFRAPTLFQRFSDSGVPTLRPESSHNREFGLRYVDGPLNLGLVAYRNNVSDLITYVAGAGACASTDGCYTSTGRARYEGITATAAHAVGKLKLRGSVDFQDPRDLVTGKQLTRRAKRHASLGADLPVSGWNLGAEVLASGARFDDAANTRVLGGYTLLNLTASTSVGRDLTLFTRVNNATGKRYQTARQYDTGGRQLQVSLRWAPQ